MDPDLARMYDLPADLRLRSARRSFYRKIYSLTFAFLFKLFVRDVAVQERRRVYYRKGSLESLAPFFYIRYPFFTAIACNCNAH